MLFYTNGISINNSKHVLMKNGNGLMGDLSSTNNVVIVPLPGSNSIYYLFTVGAQRQPEKGFRYSIIDMNGDAGLGEVTQKNILIEDEAFEKLAAIHHCNKTDVWVTIQKWNTNEYHSYLVTYAGLSAAPVVSHGSYTPINPIGTLKFSSNGKKLAAVYSYEDDQVELMDFDNTTGVLTNPIYFSPETTPPSPDAYDILAYGAEFSPSGNILYISSNNADTGPSSLYQFDITSGNSSIIRASKKIIAQIFPWVAGGLQIGPDQKIYMSMGKDTAISLIDDPDQLGPACNFQYNKISLKGPSNAFAQFGLPNFIQSYFDPRSFYDFSRSGDCTEHQVKFTLNKTLGIDSVKWDFGDGNSSTLIAPVHNYIGGGYYTVSLRVYKNDCSGSLFETITHQIWISDSSVFLGTDTSSCDAFALEIGVDEIPGFNYLWNTGSSKSKITTTGFGEYWLEIDQNGCKMRDSIKILSKPKPEVVLGADTSICKYKPVVLKAGNTYDSYLWSTGATTPSIFVDQIGTYFITVTQSGCEASDTILVKYGDCDIYIPSAFTPNNDNLNETFGVVDNSNVQNFSMKIFNRWGGLIFNSSDITQKWDGNFKGKKMPNGAYFWMCSYVNRRGIKVYDQGMVQLIR